MYIKVESPKDASNLSNLLKDGNWMVLYYAEWCGHCKTMKPEWQKVVNKMSKSNTVNVAEVESEHIGELAHKPKVDGFPSIKMYNKGSEVSNFEDERVADKIEKFANDNANVKKEITMIDTKNSKTKPKPNIKPNIKKQLPVLPTQQPTIEDISQLESLEKIKPFEKETINLYNEPKIGNTIKNQADNQGVKVNQEVINLVKPKKIDLRPQSNELLTQMPIIQNAPMAPNKNRQPRHGKKPSQGKKTNKRPNPMNTNYLNMPCEKITKAKQCKSNPKCMYDGSVYKCKDKPIVADNKQQQGKVKRSSKTKATTMPSPTPSNNSKNTHTKENNKKENNVRKTTKNVFEQLIKSFGRIGEEAIRDSKLLKEATTHLV